MHLSTVPRQFQIVISQLQLGNKQIHFEINQYQFGFNLIQIETCFVIFSLFCSIHLSPFRNV